MNIDKANDAPKSPLEYEVGETCKCYFSEIIKNRYARISQQINKCQSFGKVIAKNPENEKCYTVQLFDAEHTVKKLPGRCLRKVKVEPFGIADAKELIGKTVESSKEGKVVMMVVSVAEDHGVTLINELESEELLEEFVFSETGAPCGRIVMLKADEAFSDEEA